MPSIQDWTARAARRICIEVNAPTLLAREERFAAIIATYAAPLVRLLNEARRPHDRGWNEESCDYAPCPKSQEEHEGCTCGADAWNARIDRALEGLEE
jgi:hypothetical protein